MVKIVNYTVRIAHTIQIDAIQFDFVRIQSESCHRYRTTDGASNVKRKIRRYKQTNTVSL